MSWIPITIFMNYHVCLYGSVAIPINKHHIIVFGGCSDGNKSSSETSKNEILLLNLNRQNNLTKTADSESNDGIWSVLKVKGTIRK